MEQVELFEKTANLSASINDVHNTIDLLTTARAKIAAGARPVPAFGRSMANHHRADPQTAPLTLAKLQDPLKKSLEAAQKDIKPIYSGLGKYGKALDKVCFSVDCVDGLY